MIFPAGLPLIHGPDYTEWLAAWAADRIPHMSGGFGPCWAVGVVRNSDLAAVCVYHDWREPHDVIQMSIASATPRWVSRQVLAALLGVPFLHPLALGARVCRKVNAYCALDNTHACQFVEGIGFRKGPIIPHELGHKKHIQMFSMYARDFAHRYGGLT